MKIVEIVSRQIPYARTGAVDSEVVAIGRQIEIEKAGENRQMAEEWIVEMGAMGNTLLSSAVKRACCG